MRPQIPTRPICCRSPAQRIALLGKAQDTNSVFALWQLPIGERLNITLGGRVDDVVDVARFETWRATAAYTIAETGTKFHTSAGTGAKAPTLFQLYDPANGTPGLKPEQSFGYDAGIDQSLFNGRVIASVTGFSNDFSNLINFVSSTPTANPCRGIQTGCYVNVARAETSGLEVGTTIDVLPGLVKFNAAYTYLHAIDLATGLVLARRPKNLAHFSAHHHAHGQMADRTPRSHGFQALQQRRPDQPGRCLYPRRSLYRVQDRQELESVCARRKHPERTLSGGFQLRHHRSRGVCRV